MPFLNATNVVSAFEEKTAFEDVFDFDDGGDAGPLDAGRGDGDRALGGRANRPFRNKSVREVQVRERRDFPVNPEFQLQIGETKEGRMIYVMREDFYYCHAQSQRVFRVRRHFETDFASVPKQVWGVVNPSGRYAPAAIIHDWLYAIGETNKRDEADDIMLDAMIDLGVPFIQRHLIHEAVKAGGARGYGLPGDWAFSDPALNGKRYQDIPRRLPDKPKSAVCFVGACSDFKIPPANADSPYA